MTSFQDLALELIEAILDYLDVKSLATTSRAAKCLQYPSERRLYYKVNLCSRPMDGPRDFSPQDRQAFFLNTILNKDRLARYIVQLSIGGFFLDEGDPRVNVVIGGSMKKMINLKRLAIFGYPYIMNADLDFAPFRLTHLVISGERYLEGLGDFDTDTESEVPLLSILRAHPTLVDLELDYKRLPLRLIDALNAERISPSTESGLICPHIKRFSGSEEGLRLFLPMRTIESGMMTRDPHEFVERHQLSDIWLTPSLVQSYQRLRFLEVRNTYLLFSIAPYLTSLTHLRTHGNLYSLRMTGPGHLLWLLGQMPALQSFTLNSRAPLSRATLGVENAREVVRLVCAACPDIVEILVKARGTSTISALYYRYTKRRGLQDGLVRVASGLPWWRES